LGGSEDLRQAKNVLHSEAIGSAEA